MNVRLGTHVLAAAAAAVLAVAAPAHATYDLFPPALASSDAALQADYATQPAISADGRYIAFTGSIAGVTGIYRKDLQTGDLQLVAVGDAGAPSISASGQFVSFTTTDADPSTGQDPGQCSSVYVRDMAQPLSAAAFTLASAQNGSTHGLLYAGAPPSGQTGCPGGGSSASAGEAISADGTEVVFTVVGRSNLTGPSGQTETPPAQIAVRNLVTDTTTLVSQTMASLGGTPAPVSQGAALTDTSAAGGSSAATADGGTANADPGDSTAAISADGSTVAWLGINIPAQAPASAQDAPTTYPNEYDEPLWRRIADGAAAPTRRVLGGDDPVGPCPGGCPGPLDLQTELLDANSGADTGPEHGSLVDLTGLPPITTPGTLPTIATATPALSADGRTVAVLSTAFFVGHKPTGSGIGNTLPTNLFLVSMAPGLSRAQALTPVTALANTSGFGNDDQDGPITAAAISPQGDELAFVTDRGLFPLSPPTLITPALVTTPAPQLYLVDLVAATLQLASYGYDGQPAGAAIGPPSLSADGGPVVFASAATNLVYGAESTTGTATQVFSQSAPVAVDAPGQSSISPAPANPLVQAPAWALGATARQNRNGTVTLAVRAPGPGAVAATARCTVLELALLEHRRHRHRRRAGTATTTVRLARSRAATHAAGAVDLVLRPASRYRFLTRAARGLYATVTVTFAAAGHPTLTHTLPVVFERSARHHRARSTAHRGSRR